MPEAAEIRCTGCKTHVIVFPSTLYGLVPAELQDEFLEEALRTTTEDGRRFAVADDTGAFTCPECGRPSIVPVVDFN